MSILDAEEKNDASQPYSSFKKRKGLPIMVSLIGVILLIILTAGGVIYIARSHPEVLGLAKTNQEDKKDLERTIAQVSKIMLLPEETPTLATVSDLEKIKGQVFFKNAQVGDKVLVYTGAKKAILYRPLENKIIEVGVVNVPSQSPQAPGNTSQVSGVSTDSESFIPTATSIPPKVNQPVLNTPTPSFTPTIFIPTITPNSE